MLPTLAQQTEAVITRHLQAIVSGAGIDEILKDYTDESFVLTQHGPVRGLKELRPYFEAFIASLTPEIISNIQVLRLDYEGEAAYLYYSALPLVTLGTDTFIVHDGKIIAQTSTMLGQ